MKNCVTICVNFQPKSTISHKTKYFSSDVSCRGRFGHVAASAYGNILLIAGGYSGYMLGDLIAYKFPPTVAPPKVSSTRSHTLVLYTGNIKSPNALLTVSVYHTQVVYWEWHL